jgi:uronate dehydrogenase
VAEDRGLPLYTDTRRWRRPTRRRRQGRILITGASGIIGTIVARGLSNDFHLTGLDLRRTTTSRQLAQFRRGSVTDRALLRRLATRAEVIIHLATGSERGWDGLLEVEIDGTRNVLDAAIAGGCHRVILASSVHVAWWDAMDGLEASEPMEPRLGPTRPVRPDGLYGVAKVTLEALGRTCAEWTGLGVSIVRLGCVRPEDDLQACVRSRLFSYLGDDATVERHLQQVWLSHPDLVRIVREEMQATEPYRLRFATSQQGDPIWTVDAYSWAPDAT